MSDRCGKPYRPSNGTEGDWFLSKFCLHCIHGKYEHTGDVIDNPCEIITASFFSEIGTSTYPPEWVYDDNEEPTCTAWRKWDWGRDDDGNWIEPEPVYPDDPNQLCLPFIFDELEIKQHEQEEAATNQR